MTKHFRAKHATARRHHNAPRRHRKAPHSTSDLGDNPPQLGVSHATSHCSAQLGGTTLQTTTTHTKTPHISTPLDAKAIHIISPQSSASLHFFSSTPLDDRSSHVVSRHVTSRRHLTARLPTPARYTSRRHDTADNDNSPHHTAHQYIPRRQRNAPHLDPFLGVTSLLQWWRCISLRRRHALRRIRERRRTRTASLGLPRTRMVGAWPSPSFPSSRLVWPLAL